MCGGWNGDSDKDEHACEHRGVERGVQAVQDKNLSLSEVMDAMGLLAMVDGRESSLWFGSLGEVEVVPKGEVFRWRGR